MKKPKNQFASLSQEDQKYILDLCAKETYDDIVDLLRKPRADGGLDIITSRAALCRFFTTFRQDSALAVLAQIAAAENIRQEQNSNAFLGAIRATVEARVFEQLRNGRALADMEKDFRFLRTIEILYLADAKWRAGNPKAARPAYQRLVDTCANAPEIDFIPVAEANNHLEGTDLIDAGSEFDLDVSKSRERQQRDAESRARILASLQARGIGADALPDSQKIEKSPVIPHIPPNSSNSPVPPRPNPSEPAQPAATPPQKPVPYVSPTPKVGRNDPCPCGSGRKAKKCCHR